MAYRPHWSAEGLSEVTVPASTTYSDLVTLTHAAADQVASADYVAFWTANGQIDSATTDYNLRLLKDGSQAVLVNNEAQEIATPIDYDAQGGMYFYNAGATPADVELKIQIACETAAGTAKAKDGRLSVMALGANDVFATSTARVTRTSSTFANTLCSVTFTPPSSGTYILIATALLDSATGAAAAAQMRISDGTNNSLTAMLRAPKDAANRTAASIVWRQTGVSGSKTYRIQYASEDNSATIGISEMRLLILREADFDNVYYTVQGADSSGTQTAYTTPTNASQTFTPVANDHLTMASLRFGGSVNSVSSYTQFLDGATVVNEAVREPTQAAGRYTGYSHRIAAYPATSRTQAIQRKSETSSTTTLQADVCAIATFDLGTAPSGGYTLTAATGAFTETGVAAGVRVARQLPTAVGAFALTGNAAAFRKGYTLGTAAGSFTLGGQAAALRATRRLPAAVGTFALAGNATGIKRGLRLAAGTGAYTLTGNSAGLGRGLKLIGGTGAFILTGIAATLTKSSSTTNYTLTAATGTFSLNGQAAALKVARRVAAGLGAFTLTGQAAGLRRGRRLNASAGAFVLSGKAATLRRSYAISTEAGVFNLTGVVAVLDWSGLFILSAYPVQGAAASAGSATSTAAVARAVARSTVISSPSGGASTITAYPVSPSIEVSE